MSPVKTLLLAALLPLLAQATPLRRATPQLIHPNGDKTKVRRPAAFRPGRAP